jgi:hypothetical protein
MILAKYAVACGFQPQAPIQWAKAQPKPGPGMRRAVSDGEIQLFLLEQNAIGDA